jgi:hypothetical protein
MVKYICRAAKPKSRILRCFFHANPDRLIDLTAKAAGARAQEAAAYRRQFTQILDDIYVDGVWKRTSWGRLPETEKAIVRYLMTNRTTTGERMPLRILDVGASDGSTSVNLLGSVRAAYSGPIELTLADLNVELRRFRKGFLTEYRSSRGDPAMAAFGRIGVRLPRSEHEWYRPSHAIARWYLRQSGLRSGLREDGKVPLVNPVAAHDPAIEVMELDCVIFEPSLKERFDVIRASNLISPRYGFAGQKLESCLANLHSYLKEGGCLLISRNDGNTEIERGSIWRRTPDGFTLVEGFGGGSEIEGAVTSFAAKTAEEPPGRTGGAGRRR